MLPPHKMLTAYTEKHKKRRNSPQFEGSFGHLLKNIRPPQGGKSAGGELRHHHVVLTAGAVADQQLAVLPPAHHNSYMGIDPILFVSNIFKVLVILSEALIFNHIYMRR